MEEMKAVCLARAPVVGHGEGDRVIRIAGDPGDGLGRLGRRGVGMEIRAAGRPGRPNDSANNETKEARTRSKNHDHITRPSKARIKKTKHNQDDDNNQSKIQNHEQNPHPAWNPDSRWLP